MGKTSPRRRCQECLPLSEAGIDWEKAGGISCRNDNVLYVDIDLHHAGVCNSQNSWMVELICVPGGKNHKYLTQVGDMHAELFRDKVY